MENNLQVVNGNENGSCFLKLNCNPNGKQYQAFIFDTEIAEKEGYENGCWEVVPFAAHIGEQMESETYPGIMREIANRLEKEYNQDTELFDASHVVMIFNTGECFNGAIAQIPVS